jgi:hypothetical protein
MPVETDELQRQIEEVRIMAEDALDKFPLRSTTTGGAVTERHIHVLGKHIGAANALLARATSNLTLTQSNQSITGDGDGSKVRLLIPSTGDWLIVAVVDFDETTAGAGDLKASLFVNDSGSAETGIASLNPTGGATDDGRATVPQNWIVTVTAINTPVELKALKQNAGGVGIVTATNTTLVATRGSGGGTATVSTADHGGLTGLGDDDHSIYLLVDGARAGSTGGAQDFGSNGIKTDKLVESSSGAGIIIDGAQAAAVQLTVQGAASQSTNIFTVEIASGADKLFVDSDGDTLMRGHVAMGASGTINASRILNLVELKADSNLIGAFINPVNTSSSGSSRKTTGLSGIAEWRGTSTATALDCIGLDFTARHNSGQALTNLIGLQADLVALAGGTGTIANAIGINVGTPTWTGVTGPATKLIGINVMNQGAASTDVPTWGIKVDAATIDGSNTDIHYGIQVAAPAIGTIHPIWCTTNRQAMSAITSGFDGRVIIDDDINGSSPQGGFALMVYTPVSSVTNTGPDGAGLRVGNFHGGTTSIVTAAANGHDIYGAVIDYSLVDDSKTTVAGAMLGVLGQNAGTMPEPYAILESVDVGAASINLFLSDTMVGSASATGGPPTTYPTIAGRLHVDQEDSSGAKPAIFVDQADVSEQGIKFSSSGSDIDINLFTVDVTGTPTLLWDESEDDLNLSVGLTVESREVNRYAYSI